MSFNEKIKEAKTEALRFLGKIEEWESVQGEEYGYDGRKYPISTPKENGAVKRSSMDLTRALAQLRKPHHNGS